jgi:hypothetical protein
MFASGRKLVAAVFALLAAALAIAITSSAPAFAATYSQTVLSDSPAAYYRFQETSGTTFADSTGNAHTGSLVGGYRLAQPGPVTGNGDPVGPIELR